MVNTRGIIGQTMIGLKVRKLALCCPTCILAETAVTTTRQLVRESGSLNRATARPWASVRSRAFQKAESEKSRRIITSELAPNVAVPLLSFSLVLIAVLIVAEGALAFLGLGLQQPEPTWGNMIAEGGLSTLVDYPHIPLVPGAFMFFTVLSLNRIGEKATNAWSPREARI